MPVRPGVIRAWTPAGMEAERVTSCAPKTTAACPSTVAPTAGTEVTTAGSVGTIMTSAAGRTRAGCACAPDDPGAAVGSPDGAGEAACGAGAACPASASCGACASRLLYRSRTASAVPAPSSPSTPTS